MLPESRGCPLCRRDVAVGELLTGPELDADLGALIAANTPGWTPAGGACRECVRRFATARDELGRHGVSSGAILPTPLRLAAPDRYRGRGVTVAFLDSGFYAHPDLVEPEDRILAYVDVTRTRRRAQDLRRPDESSWHGTMTSVVACGNGRRSGGLYRGVASEARLVLVKCGTLRRITHHDIQRGLEWILRNRRRFGIRVVNVSCGGDYEASYLTDGLSQAAERASREGLLVCAAVGNLGHVPGHPVLPPASAPSVLTVGGLDDQNRLDFAAYGMYHSSFGPTVDGLQKPEVIAPGIWVAAPILPGTPTAAQADLLSRLDAASDPEMKTVLAARAGIDPELDAASGLAPALLRQLVRLKLKDQKVISGAYKHVDGTSFASPIVASIAAQMLEANPRLAPRETKRLLIGTARRIAGVNADRQGWGAVDAEAAVQAALEVRSPRQASNARAVPR
ncbi:MAG: serine protease [Acidobacteria bacterium]|nr:MAG: serine protease [Acidobacteriota bacterium]